MRFLGRSGEDLMRTPRRVFIKQLATSLGAAFILRGAAQAQETPRPSRDSKLMGEAKFVDVEGARTRYFEGGQGEALVLVHGGQWPATASADGWRPIFDHLAARFRVYAFDKLGMGFTDNPKRDADYSMDAIIQHAYGFIRAVGIRRAVLVGHSRGALPVARIAVDQPELVSRLVILDSNTLAPDDPNTPERTDPAPDQKPPTREEIRRGQMASRQSVQKDFLTDAYIEAEYQIGQLPKIREVDHKFRELRDRWVRDNPEKMRENPKLGSNMGATTWWMVKAKDETLALIRAGRLKAPTIIIWGFNDPTAPYALGVNLMETISKVVDRAELHVINRSGHFVAAEHPEEVTRLIVGFVDG
jgi:2-hydroxy-6-oxonona-2,4-dienedioate hydrolase